MDDRRFWRKEEGGAVGYAKRLKHMERIGQGMNGTMMRFSPNSTSGDLIIGSANRRWRGWNGSIAKESVGFLKKK